MKQPGKFIQVSMSSTGFDGAGGANVVLAALDNRGDIWYKYIEVNNSAQKLAEAPWRPDKHSWVDRQRVWEEKALDKLDGALEPITD